MSVADFEQSLLLLHGEHGIAANDLEWFPRWIRRYALSFRGGMNQRLPVNRDVAIKFSRTLLESGAPAWQRWQAVPGEQQGSFPKGRQRIPVAQIAFVPVGLCVPGSDSPSAHAPGRELTPLRGCEEIQR